jgi:hypothetical protein
LTEPAKKHWTTHVGQAAGHPAAFLVVLVYAALWFTFSRVTFDWNAVATLAVFAMTRFIQFGAACQTGRFCGSTTMRGRN